ncbi:MAG: cytochrome c oxidase assembly protein [Gammaproteobacteria bacterium]|jgi:cytochrome c oxidase assembly protein subunit 11
MKGRSEGKNHRGLSWQLLVMTVAMFGFGFALVPLYDVFCDITGLGGRTNAEAVTVTERPDEERLITVEFVATVNQQGPWDFEPTVAKMQVHPGKLYDTTFYAKNLQSHGTVGRAVPSVSPSVAARHFTKTECFCFTNQPFEANEAKDMPVRFIVDRALPAHIDTVTLSYTFFDTEQQVAAVGSHPAD